MSIAFRVHRHSGDYVRATVVPANRKGQARFGVLDAIIIAAFLLAVGGLFFLLGRG